MHRKTILLHALFISSFATTIIAGTTTITVPNKVACVIDRYQAAKKQCPQSEHHHLRKHFIMHEDCRLNEKIGVGLHMMTIERDADISFEIADTLHELTDNPLAIAEKLGYNKFEHIRTVLESKGYYGMHVSSRVHAIAQAFRHEMRHYPAHIRTIFTPKILYLEAAERNSQEPIEAVNMGLEIAALIPEDAEEIITLLYEEPVFSMKTSLLQCANRLGYTKYPHIASLLQKNDPKGSLVKRMNNIIRNCGNGDEWNEEPNSLENQTRALQQLKELLASHNININLGPIAPLNPLFNAIQSNCPPSVIARLLKKGASATRPLRWGSAHEYTPITRALETITNTKSCKLLLNSITSRSFFNTRDESGNTPLMHAINTYHKELIENDDQHKDRCLQVIRHILEKEISRSTLMSARALNTKHINAIPEDAVHDARDGEIEKMLEYKLRYVTY